MRRGILIISICILASILIFLSSMNIANKSYGDEETDKISEAEEPYLPGPEEVPPKEEETLPKEEEALPEPKEDQEMSLPEEDMELPVIEEDRDESAEEDNAAVMSEESAPDDNDTSVEDVPTEEHDKSMLVFVDKQKEVHQAEIDIDVKKHDYDLDCFSLSDCKMSYDGDDRYTYRLGIDVSHHNGDIDWEAVKDFGIDFAFLRVAYRGYGAEGLLNEDKKFREYIDGAQDAGLDVGCYVFSQAVTSDEAIEEAELALDILKDYELQLPVVYDAEIIQDANARTDYISGEQFTENAAAFCKCIEAAGYEPMIYCDMTWEAYQYDMKKLEGYRIWYADYEPLPQTLYDFDIWQYTSTGRVPGIEDLVDMDIQLIQVN